MSHSLSILLRVGHLACFHFEAVRNNATGTLLHTSCAQVCPSLFRVHLGVKSLWQGIHVFNFSRHATPFAKE